MEIVNSINDALWSYVITIVLVGAAIYFTVRSRGVQFRFLKDALRIMAGRDRNTHKSALAHPKKIGSFTTTWHFDLHFPDPENSKLFPGGEFIAATKDNPIHPYAVPYRTLYSRNINNMFMAGRNISVTHVTLGSTRLMRTIGMMGEVVGMAASICTKHNALPRDVYQKYLSELKSLMKKGAARTDIELPDNQHFNEGVYLEKPKDIVF